MRNKTIYLDNASTTKVYPSVIEEIKKINSAEIEGYGNASSVHAIGEKARKLVDSARERLALEIGARAEEIVFTSGGTESDNLAIIGVARANSHTGKKRILISSIEHPAVYEPAMSLRKEGFEVIEIPVDKEGLVDLGFIEKNVDETVLLVSVMHVNNEIGSVQNIAKIGEICRKKGVLFHTDAVQSFGKLEVNVNKMNIDLLSASAHKIGGLKGVGMLFVRTGVKISPILLGGWQERGLRSGTENVSGIIGMAKALEEYKKLDKKKIGELRDKLITGLLALGGKINGSLSNRIWNNVNASFSGVEGDSLVMFLSKKGIMCSTGSACSSKKKEQNRVLKAIGLSEKEADGTVRFSLSGENNVKEIERTIEAVKESLKVLRG